MNRIVYVFDDREFLVLALRVLRQHHIDHRLQPKRKISQYKINLVTAFRNSERAKLTAHNLNVISEKKR